MRIYWTTLYVYPIPILLSTLRIFINPTPILLYTLRIFIYPTLIVLLYAQRIPIFSPPGLFFTLRISISTNLYPDIILLSYSCTTFTLRLSLYLTPILTYTLILSIYPTPILLYTLRLSTYPTPILLYTLRISINPTPILLYTLRITIYHSVYFDDSLMYGRYIGYSRIHKSNIYFILYWINSKQNLTWFSFLQVVSIQCMVV